MRTRIAVRLGVLAGFAVVAGLRAQPPEPGELLGSTGNQGNSLITIDATNGGGTLRCALGTLGPVTEIEYRADGTLFAATGQGSSNIIVIDPDGCAESLIGQHDFGSVNGLEFVGGTLYGAFFEPPEGEGIPITSLVIVDQTDGSLTPVGEITGYSPVRGLAYDAASATLFAIGSAIPTEGFGDELLVLDLATGQPTPVGSTGESLGSLEFGPDGVLYAGEAQGRVEGPVSARLFTLDLGTGAATPVGETSFPAVSGLAFVPGGAASVLAIPTLSRSGVVLLALLLAAAGLLLVRRS